VQRSLFGAQRPGDVAAVADLVIRCHERDVPACPGTGCGSGGAASSGLPLPSVGSRPTAPGAAEKRLLDVQSIHLDQ
jgi:hypothetical protein